jgi:hypothetical protein
MERVVINKISPNTSLPKRGNRTKLPTLLREDPFFGQKVMFMVNFWDNFGRNRVKTNGKLFHPKSRLNNS